MCLFYFGGFHSILVLVLGWAGIGDGCTRACWRAGEQSDGLGALLLCCALLSSAFPTLQYAWVNSFPVRTGVPAWTGQSAHCMNGHSKTPSTPCQTKTAYFNLINFFLCVYREWYCWNNHPFSISTKVTAGEIELKNHMAKTSPYITVFHN